MGDEFADSSYKMPVAVKVAFAVTDEFAQCSPSWKLEKDIQIPLLQETPISMGIGSQTHNSRFHFQGLLRRPIRFLFQRHSVYGDMAGKPIGV